MTLPVLRRVARVSLLMLWPLFWLLTVHAQSAQEISPEAPIADADADHVQERAEWFSRGRVVPGKSAAALRHRAYQAKMQARATRLSRAQAALPDLPAPPSSGSWTPLGPVPLASDASGGLQDYHQVSGRATTVAIDPADPTGNTVYIGGAQGGVWKSTNAAASIANNATWTAVTDDQATLSTGAIVIQPGNSDPTKSVILVGTGEPGGCARLLLPSRGNRHLLSEKLGCCDTLPCHGHCQTARGSKKRDQETTEDSQVARRKVYFWTEAECVGT
jgi:hypothetical protein